MLEPWILSITSPQRASGSRMNHQPHLDNKPMFLDFKLPKPRPPLIEGLETKIHLAKGFTLLPFDLPKRRNTIGVESQKPLREAREKMTCST